MAAAHGDMDGFGGFRFWVEIDNLLVAAFKECSGLSAEIEVETYQEGGLNDYEHKLPGRAKFGNVTLTTGLSNSPVLWEWFYNGTMGAFGRRNVSIVLYAKGSSEKMRWNLTAAYPVNWQGPSFNTEDNSVAVQSLELAHHGLSLAVS